MKFNKIEAKPLSEEMSDNGYVASLQKNSEAGDPAYADAIDSMEKHQKEMASVMVEKDKEAKKVFGKGTTSSTEVIESMAETKAEIITENKKDSISEVNVSGASHANIGDKVDGKEIVEITETSDPRYKVLNEVDIETHIWFDVKYDDGSIDTVVRKDDENVTESLTEEKKPDNKIVLRDLWDQVYQSLVRSDDENIIAALGKGQYDIYDVNNAGKSDSDDLIVITDSNHEFAKEIANKFDLETIEEGTDLYIKVPQGSEVRWEFVSDEYKPNVAEEDEIEIEDDESEDVTIEEETPVMDDENPSDVDEEPVYYDSEEKTEMGDIMFDEIEDGEPVYDDSEIDSMNLEDDEIEEAFESPDYVNDCNYEDLVELSVDDAYLMIDRTLSHNDVSNEDAESIALKTFGCNFNDLPDDVKFGIDLYLSDNTEDVELEEDKQIEVKVATPVASPIEDIDEFDDDDSFIGRAELSDAIDEIEENLDFDDDFEGEEDTLDITESISLKEIEDAGKRDELVKLATQFFVNPTEEDLETLIEDEDWIRNTLGMNKE